MATALPPPFDLQTALNWDRDQKMAKAAQLAGGDQGAEVPPQDATQLDLNAVVAMGARIDGAEGVS